MIALFYRYSIAYIATRKKKVFSVLNVSITPGLKNTDPFALFHMLCGD